MISNGFNVGDMKTRLQLNLNVLAVVLLTSILLASNANSQARQEILSSDLLKSTQTAIFKKDSACTFKYNTTSLSYEAIWKKQYNYNDNNTVESIEYYLFDKVDNSYIAKWKEEYSYNEKNQLTECLFLENNDGWTNTQNFTYQYDNGVLQSCLVEKWDATSNSWTNWRLDTYVFDINNREKEYQIEYWNEETDEWTNSMKNTPSYDNDGLVEEKITKSFSNNIWENLAIESNTYNNSNLLTVNLKQTWNGANWVNSDRFTYSYDQNNLANSIIKYAYSEDESNWVYDQKTLRQYDSDQNIIAEVRQSFNTETSGWDISTKEESHWQKQSISTELSAQNNNIKFGLYPNPAQNDIFLTGVESGAKVNIFDMAGKQVQSTINYITGKSIDVSDLDRGFYLLKVNNQTIQFIKK